MRVRNNGVYKYGGTLPWNDFMTEVIQFINALSRIHMGISRVM